MAKAVHPAAELLTRPGDVPVTIDELAQLSLFTQLKKTPALEKYPGTFKLRHYQQGDVIWRPEIGLGIGVIDIKTTVIESAEEVARRIETAARVVGVERIKYVHPDCGFWMLQRSIADGKMRALVQGRDLFEGRRSGELTHAHDALASE